MKQEEKNIQNEKSNINEIIQKEDKNMINIDQEKAYLEGFKFSTLYLLLITIIKIVIKTNFNYKTFIMYFGLILTSIIGSMFGINIKKNS